MGLKILHSADWHLDSPFAGFSPEQRAYLSREAGKIPDKIADLCLREHCDLVLLSGDLFDGPYRKETAELMKAALARCQVPVCISPGNHDPLTAASPWLREVWPENVHIFSRGLSSRVFPQLDCRVWGAGYDSMDCPSLLDGFRAEGPETYQVGILHGAPLSSTSPYCPVTQAQVRTSRLSCLALGHIHKAGSFQAGNTLCAWPGCPMGRGWDETGEKGVNLITLGETAQIRFLSLDTPRFRVVESEDANPDVLPADHSHFCRLVLTGTDDTPLDILQTRFRDWPNLILIDRRHIPADPWDRMGGDTLEGIYFRLLRQKLDAADPEESSIVQLAAEISQRILEGREVVL